MNAFSQLRRYTFVASQLRAELPGLTGRLAAAGCTRVNYLDGLPPTMADRSGRAEDAAAAAVTGRRPVIESVIAAAAAAQAGLCIRRGEQVAGLLAGTGAIAGVPHVTGVRTAAGGELAADLVVDATGRRSAARHWLAALGARAPLAQSQDSGFVYYSRYFTGGQHPVLQGNPLSAVGSISLLTLEGDNNTWSVTVYGETGDAPLKAMRDPDTFARVVRECPLQAHWLDGTPITEVLPMAGVMDRSTRFVVDGQPVVTGFAAVGDAWACTEPRHRPRHGPAVRGHQHGHGARPRRPGHRALGRHGRHRHPPPASYGRTR